MIPIQCFRYLNKCSYAGISTLITYKNIYKEAYLHYTLKMHTAMHLPPHVEYDAIDITYIFYTLFYFFLYFFFEVFICAAAYASLQNISQHILKM